MVSSEFPAPNATATPMEPVLRAVLMADLVDSTALVQLLGDAKAAALMQRLELGLRELLRPTRGQLIDKADGVLVLFERPISAVDFALRYQRLLLDVAGEAGAPPVRARVGIHVGEVMTWANDPRAVAAGAKPTEVEGLAKPVAARLMALALPGQILMSGMAQTLAQRASAELGQRGDTLQWAMHGRYRFKGVAAPMLVHEVGVLGESPLRAPPSGPKVWREVPLWRRPPVLAVEIAAVIGIAVASLYGTFKSPPALAFNQRDWVVVGDLNNLTGQDQLTDPLKTALRIGLQQSTFVNLISDQRVDETLKRMGRSPDTPVDRAIGAEIAAREGARALVLPTLTESGGELRISLELIDPVSRATVYSDEASSKNPDDMLAAVDDVLERLRGQLGESVASIKETSVPLEQATTSNLDAFRAYTLGQKAKAQSRFGDAIALQEQAIRLDPDFALAYIALGSLKFVVGDDQAAFNNLEKAKSKRERLSLRENLYLDAAGKLYGPLDPMLESWKLVAAMYPDEFRAHYNYAFFTIQYGYDYAGALAFLRPALSVQNPARGNAEYLQGHLLLGLERGPEALLAFEQAEALGVGGEKSSYASVYAAQRRFDQARKVLDSQTRTGADLIDLSLEQEYATLLADEGRWDEAITKLQELSQKAAPVSQDLALRSAGSALTLRSFAPDAEFDRDIAAYLDQSLRAFDEASPTRRHDLAFNVVAMSVFAARTGQVDRAQKVLAAMREYSTHGGRPDLEGLWTVAQAEIELAQGKSRDAVSRLEAAIESHQAPYMAHAVLLRAQAALGESALARSQAEWLFAHRGMAYAEVGNSFMLQAANVVESDLALDSAAQLHDQAGNADQSNKRKAAFDAAWGSKAAAVVNERNRQLAPGFKRSG